MRPSDYMQRNPVSLNISRSKFNMSPRWTGTFNAYRLVPVFTYSDILPGDTLKLNTNLVVRMSTPVAPVMDDLFLDVAFYFVPHDLILSRSYMSPSTNDSNHSWKAFIGAQDSLLNMPVPANGITLPFLRVYDSTYTPQGIADCMGIPLPKANTSYKVNCLAALAFMSVWNENYRDPNTENPGVFSISSGQVNLSWSAANLTNSADIGKAILPHVCRFHGYFGSALPWPQRNSTSVLLPLGSTAPIIAGSTVTSFGGSITLTAGTNLTPFGRHQLNIENTENNSQNIGKFTYNTTAETGTGTNFVTGSNLIADLANASAVSINTFRASVQAQRWYEALARGGNREDELTAALFGVMPKNAGQGQPEYLGGKRIPIQVSQVNVTANSSAGSDNQDVGKTGAFSLTGDSDYYFTKSFDTWGTVIGVACVRFRDSFGRSLNRMFTRKERFDFYWAQFANLGEQPIYQHEADIYYNQSSNDFPTSDVFGYQEAWAEYRMFPDIVCGYVRPGQSLDHWTYANAFVNENGATTQTADISLAGYLAGSYAPNAIDRTLVTSSSLGGFQFLGQFQFDCTFVRPMPLYSIPGLVDHN